MSAQTETKDGLVLRQEVLGSRRLSNYFWAVISAIGGVGFLLAGLSSYLQTNLLVVSDPSQLVFIPQGVALLFYGVAGSLVALYQVLLIVWDVGGGYNEFDKKTGKLTIFRSGYPGKNRRIEFVSKLEEVQSVRAEIRDGLNPKRNLYLRVKKRRDIPLTRVGTPISLSELENQGAELARFLNVPLEGL
ncbi:photosystem I assembly protein Ycf4 [Oscillatoria sp. FACHB-1406]|uniref:photosystem I assembly protein Ycf4 n=1 Tax=Oscillatoria sp. FACHB-1406 TaxID=2692846 RepID=UPI0016846597|nr:photosystem I assembly protein Ycf4 [Oscillatoria sp. FACHB-1406]MBD2576436.1 photosystem I assembly protein Ycf4 [Oscillatoria sp. FACHB-1406]